MEKDDAFEDLLGKVRQGDGQAAAELVSRFEPEVRRFVRYRLSNPRMRRFLDSLDICQSVFANFFVRVADGQFDLHHPKQLQQLLMTMAGNRLLDHGRKHATARRGGDGAVASSAIDVLADTAAGPARQAEARDVVDVLRAKLSTDERQLLDQWMHGEEWAVIASQTGASPEAVRKRFARAVDRAAQELGLEDSA